MIVMKIKKTKDTKKCYIKQKLNPIVHGGINLPPPPSVGFFLITFFSLKLRVWNFRTLSFYPLDTMWRTFIKKYCLVDKLWHCCHQWLEIFCQEIFLLTNTGPCFLLVVFPFILFYNFILVNYFCQWDCQKSNYQYWHFLHE